MLNNITVMGRLATDLELRRTANGTAVCSFSIASDRDVKGEDGQKGVDWLHIIAWRNNAEYLSKYGTKGRVVVVNGRLQCREYTDKNGAKRTAWEINAANVYFGDAPQKKETELKLAPVEEDEELPF